MLSNGLDKAAVVGAGGKMGSGIALLLLQAGAHVTCYDTRQEALDGLRRYLTHQLTKNSKEHCLDNATFTTELADLAGSELLFEAIVEDLESKVRLYQEINAIATPYIFTNTSSIPIGLLDQRAALSGRLIGFHFYNPPAVQKLLELITSPSTDPALIELARDLAKKLGKTLVPSNDIAGFIGNGHFMRELLYACSGAHNASDIIRLNEISHKFLLRPMGIFQLIDYVGIDVCQKILRTMNRYIEGETLHSPLIDRMIEADIRGGQFSDGTQRNGFLCYDDQGSHKVFDLESGSYKEISMELTPLAFAQPTWKELVKAPDREAKLASYFSNLSKSGDPLAQEAMDYLSESARIGKLLVDSGVSPSESEVNQVLTLGFYHLYGPINDYSKAPVA